MLALIVVAVAIVALIAAVAWDVDREERRRG